MVERLVRQGAQVVVVDNGLTGVPPLDNANVKTVLADVRDSGCLDGLLQGVDGVVHLAAIVGDRACDIDPEFTWDTNYLATVNVADACRRAGVRRMVFASTCSNYGVSLGQTADVLSPLRPQSVYAESKLRAEHHLLAAGDEQFSPCILRLATIFGVSARMRFDLVVNVMTARAVTQGRVNVHGGDQWRPFLHVRDAAGLMSSALSSPRRHGAEIYNCGSDDENYRLIEVGHLVASEVGNTHVAVDPGLADPRNYRVDFAMTSAALGYRCKWSLRDGVRELRAAIATGQYGDISSGEFDNYRMTRRYLGIEDELVARDALVVR